MHHTPGVNPFKPMMNIIVPKPRNHSSMKTLVTIAKDLHYLYKDDYNVIITPEFEGKKVDILPDNTTIVKLTIDESTDYEKLLKYLEELPKIVKRVEETEVSDVQ